MLFMLCSNIVICTMVSCFVHELIFMIFIYLLQKFEDTKGVIGSRKSKIRVITKLPNSEQSDKISQQPEKDRHQLLRVHPESRRAH